MARLVRAVVVYDVGGWTASAITEPFELDGLTVLVAPNGSGKTTILSSLHPVLSAPSSAHMDYVRVVLRGYSSLRLTPPAVGYSEVLVGGERYSVAWVRVSVGLEHRSPIGFGDRVERILSAVERAAGGAARDIVERLVEASANIELDVRTPRLVESYPAEAMVNRLRQVLEGFAEEWSAVEVLPGSEEGFRIGRPGDILDSYLSVLTRAEGRGGRLLAAMLSHYIGGNAVAVRFLTEEATRGLQVVHYHPSLSTKRARSVDVAEAVWGVVAQESEKRRMVLGVCEQLVEGCSGLETLRVRGVRVLGVRVEGVTGGTYFIPLETLGDGQRSLLLLSLLSAYTTLLSRPRLLTVDTPEAYAHPDFQRIVAKLLVSTAKESSVVVATQSLEMLQEILVQADLEGVLSSTRLIRLRVKREPLDGTLFSRISYEILSGDEAYSLVEQQGLDVRLYHAAV